MYSDLYFGHTSNEQAVSQSADTPVYWYLYNYVYENGNVDEHVSGVDGIIFVRIIGVVEAGEENRGDMRATNVSSDVDLLMSSAILIYQV